MTVASLLARGQAAAESRMVDSCTAVVPGDLNDATFNPETGEYDNPGVTLYTGPGRVRYQQWAATPESGGTVAVVTRSVLHLPVAAPLLPVDCDVTITDSRDPGLVGAVFRVRETMKQTDATARRYIVEEQQS